MPSHYLSQCWNIVNWTLANNFSKILIEIHTFSFRNMHLKILYGKWRPFCLCLNVLKLIHVIISYLGMKSWDLHVCDRASTITHVDRVNKSNPWYSKIWLCLNVTIWSSQICFSVIFIHFVMIQNIWEKKIGLSHTFFNHLSLLPLDEQRCWEVCSAPGVGCTSEVLRGALLILWLNMDL